MTDANPGPRRQRRGIYLLPNLFTTAALFAGFYAIVAAMDARFEAAAAAIFVAMVLDGADGRIARMTNTQSAFGAGVRFALRCHLLRSRPGPHRVRVGAVGAWASSAGSPRSSSPRRPHCGSPGSTPSSGPPTSRYFQGLPCPAAGATVAGLVWFANDYGLQGGEIAAVAFAMTVAIAGLMVSNIRFHSFKDLDLRGRVPFMTILVVVILFVFVSSDPPLVLFLGTFAYAASGPVLTLWSIRKRRAKRRAGAGEPPRDVGTD